MTITLAFMLPIVVIWLVANTAGWLSIRRVGNRPWNWRVLAWPPLYYRWLDRRHAHAALALRDE